ncbi:hypothetical protein WMY93_033880, partial [Mugilogobius chulae]
IDKLRALTSAQTKPQPVSDPGLTPDPRASRKPERSKSTCEETSRIIKGKVMRTLFWELCKFEATPQCFTHSPKQRRVPSVNEIWPGTDRKPIINEAKRAAIVGLLAQLRATNPTTPLVSTLDTQQQGTQHLEETLESGESPSPSSPKTEKKDTPAGVSVADTPADTPAAEIVDDFKKFRLGAKQGLKDRDNAQQAGSHAFKFCKYMADNLPPAATSANLRFLNQTDRLRR